MGRGHSTTRRAGAALVALAVVVGGAACSGDDGPGPDTTVGTTVPPETTTTTEAPLEAGTRAYVWEPEVGQCFDRRTLSEEEGGDEIVLLLDCSLPHHAEVFLVAQIDEAALPAPSTTTSTTTPPTTAASTTTVRPGADDDASTTTTIDASDAIDVDLDDEATDAAPTTTEGWPGDDAVERYAKRVCAAAFDPWAGIAYELSSLEIDWTVPDEDAWADGDRTLVCTVYDPARTAEAPVRLSGSMAGAAR